jgi:nucleotide-binding universal stress UspA family protein
VTAAAERPILICYDGSPESERALAAADALLLHGRTVVVDVALPPTLEEREATFLDPGRDPVALRARETRRTAHRGAQKAQVAGFAAVERVAVALPAWQGVVDLADSIDASVIVVGSRGLSTAGELFERSTSHALAVHSGRPVLIVPPPHG